VRRKEIKSEKGDWVIRIRPETGGFNYEQAEQLYIIINWEGRTRVCCIKLGWFVVGSEKLIDFGDSWFSAKAIKVVCFSRINWVKLLINLGHQNY